MLWHDIVKSLIVIILFLGGAFAIRLSLIADENRRENETSAPTLGRVALINAAGLGMIAAAIVVIAYG